MKKLKLFILALLTLALAAGPVTGCKRTSTSVEISAGDIRSMAVDGQGTVYLLSVRGLQAYALSGDKRLEYVFDTKELSSAQFEWRDSGERLVYRDFQPERLIADGETGLQFLGRYMTNDAGRDSDLFVVQDILDMNYTAAYFGEIERDYKAGTPIVNGVGVTKSGVYLKLNRPYVGRDKYNDGTNFWFNGLVEARTLPDGVIGAVGQAEDLEENVWFLTEDGEGYKILDGENKVLKEYAAVDAAGAFSDTESFYVIFSDGRVVRWTPEEGEKDFKDLGVKIEEARDPFIWDGQIYWLDGEGVKTVK